MNQLKDSTSTPKNTKPYWQFGIYIINQMEKFEEVNIESVPYESWTEDDYEAHHDRKAYLIYERKQEILYQLQRLIADFKKVCNCYNVDPVNFSWVCEHMMDSERRSYYLEKCLFGLENCEAVVCLREL